MTKRAKPARAHTHWTPQEDSALLLGVGSDTPIDQVARFLQRPIAAVFKRLHTQHREAWLASGHQQCHPWKAEGMAKARAARLEPEPSPEPEEPAQLRLVPEPPAETLPPWAATLMVCVRDQEAVIADLRTRVAHLEREWGIEA